MGQFHDLNVICLEGVITKCECVTRIDLKDNDQNKTFSGCREFSAI